MHADARGGPVAIQTLEPDRPVRERLHVLADDHHLVADRLHHAGVVRQRLRDRLDEALDERQRLLLALLLGESRVAGEVAERERHPHAAELSVLVAEVHLHVPHHVLLHEVLEKAAVDEVHDRRGKRQEVAREVLHLLRHLESGHALAHQRLVDVDVEQPRLGVGDLRDGLPVDPREL